MSTRHEVLGVRTAAPARRVDAPVKHYGFRVNADPDVWWCDGALGASLFRTREEAERHLSLLQLDQSRR